MSNIVEHHKMSKGAFDGLCGGGLTELLVMEIVACFHIRNGAKQSDGSLGRIEITHNELRDILSYAYLEGYNRGVGAL